MSKSSAKILFMMSGSIAAYKACFVLSRLTQAGHSVQVVTTPNTFYFVGPSTLEGLTGRSVLTDTFTPGRAMDHIHWVRWADLIILCPATAHTINKMSQGLGDNLITTLFLAHDFTKPFLVVPAMNSAMYNHPTTKRSLQNLTEMGLRILEPPSGALACGETGPGRLLEPETILEAILQALTKPKGLRILITSGGTIEPIDAMRVITNLSTGRTGALLAEALFDQGMTVDYLAGSTATLPQRPCTVMRFTHFEDLRHQIQKAVSAGRYDAVIHCAAVSDFHVSKPGSPPSSAFKLSSKEPVTLELRPNPKILPQIKNFVAKDQIASDQIASDQIAPIVLGFKYTATDNLQERADAIQRLFAEGTVDAVIHNDHADIDRERDLHRFTFVTKQGERIEIPDRKVLATQVTTYLLQEISKRESLTPAGPPPMAPQLPQTHNPNF